ncbi:pentapeptide repeat-containing protein [Rhodococcus sp. NBC_00294]|uniref:pentapeptide repeat-containing protein n=1 Tax=Rhodococcus sp. NBC_00294 TaxID=2976004 RepID=UPI002E2840DA|nr:hypothetical protein [Rhodococcus sp. NBC_00294]
MGKKPDGKDKEPRHLGWLTALGILASTITGLALFYAFAWQQAGPEWNFFLDNTTGQQIFDSARTTVTLVGVIGLGGAAFIAFRRQRSTEEAQLTAREAQLTASGALTLSQSEFQHNSVRALRERYTAAAAQLGSDSFAIRLAGVYALSSLADDWAEAGFETERQVCVDVLCAYLRTPSIPFKVTESATQPKPSIRTLSRWIGPRPKPDLEADNRAAQEGQVRGAILAVIAAKVSDFPDPGEGPWSTCAFDFSAARLDEVDFSHARFSNRVLFRGTVFTGVANFANCYLTSDDFTDAVFTDTVTFHAAYFWFRSTFTRTQFQGNALFDCAHFHMETSFDGANFSGQYCGFKLARFKSGSSTYLQEAEFDPRTTVSFTNASFDGAVMFSAATLKRAKLVEFKALRSIDVEPSLLGEDEVLLEEKGALPNFEPRLWPPINRSKRKVTAADDAPEPSGTSAGSGRGDSGTDVSTSTVSTRRFVGQVVAEHRRAKHRRPPGR